MFETNRRDAIGRAVLDFSKVLFAAQLASGFFAALPLKFRLGSFLLLVILFGLGWWICPPKKKEE